VQDKIKPVQGPDETALEEHGYFFHNVRRLIGGEAEGETEDDYDAPWQFIEEMLHNGSIAQKGRVKDRKRESAEAGKLTNSSSGCNSSNGLNCSNGLNGSDRLQVKEWQPGHMTYI
jgi:hypothetical protein